MELQRHVSQLHRVKKDFLLSFPKMFSLNLVTKNISHKNECIPVGCVPSTTVAVSGGGVCPGGLLPAQGECLTHCMLGYTPHLWTESQTGVKTLHNPKLRLLAVEMEKILEKKGSFDSAENLESCRFCTHSLRLQLQLHKVLIRHHLIMKCSAVTNLSSSDLP